MREKKLERTKQEKKDKHQIHCVGLHSAKHTHKQIKQQDKKNLAAEQRAVGQEERREKEKNPMIHALIKTTRTTAFALRRHTRTHTQQQK